MDINVLPQGLSEYLNVWYIFCVNLLSYGIIKNFEILNKEKALSKIQKKGVVFFVVIIMMGVFIYFKTTSSFEVLLLSALISPYTYNYVLKNLLKALGVSYNKLNIELL